MHPVTLDVTERIKARSRDSRAAYLERMEAARAAGPGRAKLSCANFAHAFAAAPDDDKARVRNPAAPNLAIVSAYNDMLSAHQPFERFPAIIKAAAREVGATAQFAGGVPAMCDGVTQQQPGMELSLFSRDVIAMATAVALTHDAFDGALLLGVCDKIVPGLFIGAATFGHLPTIFVPAGPMTSGVSNAEKAKIRGLYAEGKIGREELLEIEMKAYHGPGTCTFYGTANSNQMVMEMMGLHLPGAGLRAPQHAAARRADRGRGAAGGGDRRQLQRLHAVRGDRRRAEHRERRRRPAGHRRLDQPHPAPGGDGQGRGRHPHLGGFRRPLAGDPADRPGLSQRLGGRERLPRRRRHGLRGAPAARTRVWSTTDVLDRRRPRPSALSARAIPRRRRAGLARRRRAEPGARHPAPRRRPVRGRGRHPDSEGRPWQGRDQGLGGQAASTT